MTTQPEKLLLAWYGDDFTGAAAVLEVLSFAGIRSMLFLDVPTIEQLERYPDLQAIGIASTARAQSPEWMDKHLPQVFESLQALGPELIHYKICTTLDSSPTSGSIGRVIEIAANLLKPEVVPILVAAPQMRRYQIFGHLFAAQGSNVFRIDRHPVMAQHPVTPMTESDVARHISAQSEHLDISLWSLEDIAANRAPLMASGEAAKREDVITAFTIDCSDTRSEQLAGRRLWENRAGSPFVVGSQGVEFALVRHWVETGALRETIAPGTAGRCEAMVSVSGSVSPTTAEQIAWSRANGFTTIRFDVLQVCTGDSEIESEILRVVSECLRALEANTDPLVFTAEGPDDPAVVQLNETVARTDLSMSNINKRIGIALGQVLQRTLELGAIKRAVVSGGDTSGYVTGQLGIYALTALAPTIPGASLSKVHADGPMDGIELALKGGQMGSPDYFGWIRDGGGVR